MEIITGPDGRKKYRMTRSEYEAGKRRAQTLGVRAAQAPDGSIKALTDHRALAQGRASTTPRSTGHYGTEDFTQGIERAGDMITSGVLVGGGAALGAMVAHPHVGAALGITADRALRPVRDRARSGQPILAEGGAGEIAKEAAKGAIIGTATGGLSIAGKTVGDVAAASLPRATNMLPFATEAVAGAVGYEGAESVVDQRAFSPMNVVLDVGLTSAAGVGKGLGDAVRNAGKYRPSGFTPDQQALNALVDAQAFLDANKFSIESFTGQQAAQRAQPEIEALRAHLAGIPSAPNPATPAPLQLPAPPPAVPAPIKPTGQPQSTPPVLFTDTPQAQRGRLLPPPGEYTANPVAPDVPRFTSGKNSGRMVPAESAEVRASTKFQHPLSKRRFASEESAQKDLEKRAKETGADMDQLRVSAIAGKTRNTNLEDTARKSADAARARQFDAESQRQVPYSEVGDTPPPPAQPLLPEPEVPPVRKSERVPVEPPKVQVRSTLRKKESPIDGMSAEEYDRIGSALDGPLELPKRSGEEAGRDVQYPVPDEAPSATPTVRKKRVAPKPEPVTRTEPLDGAAVRAAVELSGGDTGTRVSLADLREHLPGTTRAEQDAALRKAQSDGHIVLYRNDNPQDLTQRDHDAALYLSKDAPRHMAYVKPGALDTPATPTEMPVLSPREDFSPSVDKVPTQKKKTSPEPAQSPVKGGQKSKPRRELDNARTRVLNTQRYVDGLTARGKEVPQLALDKLAEYEDQLDNILANQHPGLTAEGHAEFLETGKVNKDLIDIDEIGPPSNSVNWDEVPFDFGDETGAALNPAKAFMDYRAQKKKNTEFVKRQGDFHKQLSSASPEEKGAIITKMQDDINRFANDLPYSADEIASKVKERAKKDPVPFGVSTTHLSKENRKGLAQRAKALGIPVRGSNEKLRQTIAFEEAMQKRRHGKSPTPQEAKDSARMVSDVFNSNKKTRWTRGSLQNTLRQIDRALLDIRNPAKKDLQKRFGARGAYVAQSLENAAHSDPYADVLSHEAQQRVYGDLDKTATFTEAEYFGNPSLDSKVKLTERELLDRMIMTRSSLELSKANPTMKFTGDTNGRNFQDWVDQATATERGQLLYEKAERFFEETRQIPQRLLDEGLITEAQYEGLIGNQHYAPRRILREDNQAGLLDYLQRIDPDSTSHSGGDKVSVPDSGLQRLEGGSLKAIEDNTPALLDHVIRTTERRIQKNRAAKDLLELISSDEAAKEAGFYVRQSLKGTDKGFEAKVPHGSDTISAMVDGQRVDMVVPKWFAESWVTNDPLVNGTTAKVLRTFSMAPVLHAMATGAGAPWFFGRNLPRDLRHVWKTTDTYSAFAPKALLEIGGDLWKVRKDAWRGFSGKKTSGLMREYLENGGGGATFSDFAMREGRYSGKVKDFATATSAINQWSESLVRLAQYQRIKGLLLKSGMDPKMAARQAAAEARDRINFSQGGQYAKFANNAVPYLNARVQGTRSVAKAWKDETARTAFVTAQETILNAAKVSAIYAGGKTLYEAYDRVSDEEKAHNDVIPTPFYRTNPETGDKEYMYFRIAKDESAKISAYAGEQIGRAVQGRHVNLQPLEDMVLDQLVFSSLSSITPPAAQAMLAYWANFDLFRGEKIWQGGEVGEKRFGPDDLSYEDESANQFFKDVAAPLGLSPDRTQKAAGKILNEYNPIWGMFASAYDVIREASGGDPEKERKMNDDLIDMLLKGGTADIIKFSKSDAVANEMMAEERVSSNRQTIQEDRKIREIVKAINSPKGARSAMKLNRAWLNSLPLDRREDAAKRLANSAVIKAQAPEVQAMAKVVFWSKPEPAVQAVEYLDRFLKGTPEEKETLNKAMAISYTSKEFLYYFGKLTSKYRSEYNGAREGKVLDGLDRRKVLKELKSDE